MLRNVTTSIDGSAQVRWGVNRRKILIVEDEMITALDLRNELCHLGYEVTGLANSGEQAMRMAAQSKPDLVLMDVKLKGSMDGIETSKRIQELAPVPVVYLTANPNAFVRTTEDMQKPYMCISKPVAIPDLQAVIDIALAG
jgi:CheY-like chemotaxis protein